MLEPPKAEKPVLTLSPWKGERPWNCFSSKAFHWLREEDLNL
jgi:hypothetical protein